MLDFQFDGLDQRRQNIVESYREQGLEPPARIASPPTIRPEFAFYWSAWIDLDGERPERGRPIPVCAKLAYAAAFGVQRLDEFLDILAAVDRHFLGWLQKRDEHDRSSSADSPTTGQHQIGRGADSA